MTDYGRGGVLGTALFLPATSAAGMYFLDSTHPVIIAGFIASSMLSLVWLGAYIVRYLSNRKIS